MADLLNPGREKERRLLISEAASRGINIHIYQAVDTSDELVEFTFNPALEGEIVPGLFCLLEGRSPTDSEDVEEAVIIADEVPEKPL
jgi:hypothetical protein